MGSGYAWKVFRYNITLFSSRFVLFLLMTSVIYGIVYAIYRKWNQVLIRKHYIAESYRLMHLFLVGIMVLQVLCIVLLFYVYWIPSTVSIWGMEDRSQKVYNSMSVIWLIGMLSAFSVRLRKQMVQKKLVRSCFPAEPWVQSMARQMAESFHLKKIVQVRQGYGLMTSELLTEKGNPVILIPAGTLDEQQAEHILMHELTHYQNGDRKIRRLAAILECIHWFNPILQSLFTQLERVDELYCDYCVTGISGVDPLAYAETLYREGVRYQKLRESLKTPKNVLNIGFGKSRSVLKERIECIMETDHKRKLNYRIVAGSFTACILLTAMIFPAVVYASDRIHNGMDKGTESGIEETLRMDEYDGVEIIEEPGADAVLPEEYAEIQAEPNGLISTTVSGYSRWYSGGFYAASTQSITVSVTGNPGTVKYKAGIVEPDGTTRYIYKTGDITHKFVLSKSGTYRVFVSNPNSASVKITGSYYTADQY